MIIGFLGKGGSGKSTVATQTALWLYKQNKRVLAIDADHNMDLSFNLAPDLDPQAIPHFGSSLQEIQAHIGLLPGEKYAQAFLGDDAGTRFTFSEPAVDAYTKTYARPVREQLLLMTAGPQTDTVLYGHACSHTLTTPLKIYLPLLQLNHNDMVVVDEKAGADGVSTGIVTGLDAAVIVCEPAVHSIKTARQIAELLRFYRTPYVFVGNKITGPEDRDYLTRSLETEPVVYLPECGTLQQQPSAPALQWQETLGNLYRQLQALNVDDRLARTREKFRRNAAFSGEEA